MIFQINMAKNKKQMKKHNKNGAKGSISKKSGNKKKVSLFIRLLAYLITRYYYFIDLIYIFLFYR